MAGPHGPVGALASAYQSSPKAEGFPEASMNTVTHRLRKAFQAIEPLCGFTRLPPLVEARLSCGLSTSHVEESCHASKVAGQRKVGSEMPNRTHAFPCESFQKAGCPSGTGGCFGCAADFDQMTRSRSNVAL